MNYLHKFDPPIIHRDLKSLNIFVKKQFDQFECKIGDFGWTRIKHKKMTKTIGTFQWMAPEMVDSAVYTEKVDVYSYGIILWEIAARTPPYQNIKGFMVADMVVLNDFRPKIPKDTPPFFARLVRKCWDRQPQKRPDFDEIIVELQKMKFEDS